MKGIAFIIAGEPQSLKRHRSVRRGGGIGSYDLSKRDKEAFLLECVQYKPEAPFEIPLFVTLKFFMKRPKSHYGTGINADKLKSKKMYCVKRPDIDNLVKFVFDALNGVFWKDDSYIVHLETEKVYTKEHPHTVIEMY